MIFIRILVFIAITILWHLLCYLLFRTGIPILFAIGVYLGPWLFSGWIFTLLLAYFMSGYICNRLTFKKSAVQTEAKEVSQD